MANKYTKYLLLIIAKKTRTKIKMKYPLKLLNWQYQEVLIEENSHKVM